MSEPELTEQKKRQILRAARKKYKQDLYDNLHDQLRTIGLNGMLHSANIDDAETAVINCFGNVDREATEELLREHFGAGVTVEEYVQGDGCCEICYSEEDALRFIVTNPTLNWPTPPPELK